MKKLLNYLPLHFVLMLMLGILIQYKYQIWSLPFAYFLFFLPIVIFILLIKRKQIRTILSFVFFFCLGIALVYVNNDKNYPNYFNNVKHISELKVLRISKVLKPNLYNNKYEAEVIQISNHKVRGKILLNVRKDSIKTKFQVDEELLTDSDFIVINSQLNPHQFNYAEYLKKQGIHFQISTATKEVKSIGIKSKSAVGIASDFRNKIQKALQNYGFKDDVFGVISALLLGQRNDISKQLITDYSKAGAIHILAVSGLHVGIILILLSFLLKPLQYVKYGKVVKPIILILVLWTFATIAGLSASVVRAVTMFTFISIGLAIKSKNNVLHSLFASIFLLLVCKPMFLFDVGFQMSYLAVFGIVWFQPIFYKVLKPKNIFLKKAWQLLTVSMAAQLGVLPLSLFYFHQFPGLFFISNLIIVPFLGFILLTGILVIGLALLSVLPNFLVQFYGLVIETMNRIINGIAVKESFIIQDISFNLYQLIFSYIILFCLLLFLRSKKPLRLIVLLLAIFIFQGFVLNDLENHNSLQKFIVFHKSRKSNYGIQQGEQLLLNCATINNLQNNNIIKDYKVGESISTINKLPNSNIIQLKNQQILVLDSLGIYNLKELKSPIVLLSFSPKINLERLIATIKPTEIIADGSNFKSRINNWRKIANQNKIPFYYTGEKGAYELRFKD